MSSTSQLIRKEYREARRAFDEAIRARCEDTPRHKGRDVRFDLDDCSADDDGDTNYAYGWMHGVRATARLVGVDVDT